MTISGIKLFAQSGGPTFGSTPFTSLTLTVPAGVQIGQLLIAAVEQSATTEGNQWSAVPSGWTTERTQVTGSSGVRISGLFWRVATSVDTSSPTYTWTVGGSTGGSFICGTMSVYQGTDVVAPVHKSGQVTGTTSVTTSSLTTTIPNCVQVVYLICGNAPSGGIGGWVPSGFTSELAAANLSTCDNMAPEPVGTYGSYAFSLDGTYGHLQSYSLMLAPWFAADAISTNQSINRAGTY